MGAKWSHPLRLVGVLAVVALAGVGTLHGALRLWLLAGGAVTPVGLLPPQRHAQVQLLGFFVPMIWAFLTHALVGLIRARSSSAARMREPAVVLCALVVVAWGLAASGAAALWVNVVDAAVVAAAAWGTATMVWASWSARWRSRPFPLLAAGLLMVPVGAALQWAGWPAGMDLVLYGGVVPALLAMSARMFPALMGMQMPRSALFDGGAAVWMIAALVRVAAPASATCAGVANVLALGAAVALSVALRAFEGPRVANPRTMAGMQRLLQMHARGAHVALVVAPLLSLAGVMGVPQGAGFIDAGRHTVAVGYALVLAAGITQRALPSMVGGTPARVGVMAFNLVLVAAGVVLRLTETMLPAAAGGVQVSAALLFAGVLGYALNLAWCLTRPSPQPPPAVLTIRTHSQGVA